MTSSFLTRLEFCIRNRILSLPYIPKTQGVAFDLVVRNTIQNETGVPCVTPETWTTHDDYAPFRGAVKRHLPTADVAAKKPIVVAQPNGSQQWPDIVVIHGYNIAYIEHKTNRDDKIVWNGGLPRGNGLYLFNSGLKGVAKQTTLFLGRHALSDQDRKTLQQAADAASKAVAPFNKILKGRGSVWSNYARAMFNDKGRYIRHPDLARREEEAVVFLVDHLNRPRL